MNKIKKALFFGFIFIFSFCYILKDYFLVLNDKLTIIINLFATSNLITILVPYHNYIKICLVILSMIPLLQTTRLLKTRSANDVSVIYQFFTIIVLTCINIDIFRSQFGKADINSFIIFCRYGKICFYNLNVFLIFFLLNKINKNTISVLLSFVFIQLLVVCGMFYYPKTMFIIVDKYSVGLIISIIFVFGMFKPMIQLSKTIVKKTANDVSILYYFAFFMFLVCAILDSLIMFQINGIAVPIKTTLANIIKMILYFITFGVIFYIRYFFRKNLKIE